MTDTHVALAVVTTGSFLLLQKKQEEPSIGARHLPRALVREGEDAKTALYEAVYADLGITLRTADMEQVWDKVPAEGQTPFDGGDDTVTTVFKMELSSFQAPREDSGAYWIDMADLMYLPDREWWSNHGDAVRAAEVG